MRYEIKAPLWVKIFLGVIIVGLFGFNFFYSNYTAQKNKKAFYIKAFSSKIVSSNSFAGRTVEFHIKNGLKVYFLPPIDNKLMIGDSIVKKNDNYHYDVYRKNNHNKFKYFSTYDFDNIQ